MGLLTCAATERRGLAGIAPEAFPLAGAARVAVAESSVAAFEAARAWGMGGAHAVAAAEAAEEFLPGDEVGARFVRVTVTDEHCATPSVFCCWPCSPTDDDDGFQTRWRRWAR
jgi:hypothetical protein